MRQGSVEGPAGQGGYPVTAEQNLPTVEEMFQRVEACLTEAYWALGDAQDWLRSDWRPVGASLTDGQAEDRLRMRSEIGVAKEAINRARRG
jgi:hypothetical protein